MDDLTRTRHVTVAAWDYRVLRSEGFEVVSRMRVGGVLDQAWGALYERVLAEHTAASTEAGQPCGSCAEAWPCSAVRQVLGAPYR